MYEPYLKITGVGLVDKPMHMDSKRPETSDNEMLPFALAGESFMEDKLIRK